MITFQHKGDLKKTEKFLKRIARINIVHILEKYGREGVQALADNTPKDSGLTAESWGYEIIQNGSIYSLIWTNTNVVNGVSIALIIQYGHGTRNGAYIEGKDYINPAIRPIFDKIANSVWREVTK